MLRVVSKKRCGILGRADRGGIASQSLAVATHLGASAALIVDLKERGRGPLHLAPWQDAVPDIRVCGAPASDEDLAWFLDRVDVVYSAEGPPPFRNDFGNLCAWRDIPWFIHTNPELWRPEYQGPTTQIILPTTWHQERFHEATVLPMPVDRDRFPYRNRTECTTFLHVSAPAMCDRSGTQIVRDALEHVTEECALLVRGVTDTRVEEQVGKVAVTFLPPVEDHAQVCPPEADVLLHCRRYGGLSLIDNEAQSLGLPVVMPDLEPQRGRLGMMLVPTCGSFEEWMIGGVEQVYDVDPRMLASRMDRLVANPKVVEALSAGADAWASEHSWDTLAPLWRSTLGL